MNMKKITSLTALLSFIVLIVNSVVLYIVPHGRVSDWADWRLWGLNKTEWANQHIIIGVLFLIAIVLHLYYNWRLISSYFKNSLKHLRLFNRNFNIALIITVVGVIGSYLLVPPFNWVVDAGEFFKNNAAVKYGVPPYGQAQESTLRTLAQRTGLNLDQGLKNLRDAGVEFESAAQTPLQIAKENRLTPQQVFQVMYPETKPDQVLPTAPAPEVGSVSTIPPAGGGNETGWGRRTLTDVCREVGLDPKTAIRNLAAKGITAGPDDKIRPVAERYELKPSQILDLMK